MVTCTGGAPVGLDDAGEAHSLLHAVHHLLSGGLGALYQQGPDHGQPLLPQDLHSLVLVVSCLKYIIISRRNFRNMYLVQRVQEKHIHSLRDCFSFAEDSTLVTTYIHGEKSFNREIQGKYIIHLLTLVTGIST